MDILFSILFTIATSFYNLQKILSLVLAVLLLLGTMSVTAFADGNEATLDLESSTTTILDSKDIDQNYTFTQSGDTTYTDVTKVKLTWTVTDIAATYTSTKTWKPDTMTWDETKTAGTTTNGGATFTLTNLSSVKVNASASFKAESGFTPNTVKIGGTAITADSNSVYTGSAVTIGTVVKDDKTVDTSIDHDETIEAVITPGDNDFASLAADSGKYGTYTVTIGAAPTAKSYPITNKFYYATTADSANATSIEADGSVTLKYTASAGYPDVMFVENATLVSYDKTTGILVISNPTDDVLVKDANLLTFTANTAGSTVTPKFVEGSYQYSTNDGESWDDGDNNGGTTITLTDVGDSVLLKGKDCVTGQIGQFGPFPTFTSFSMTGSISASGDVTSITNGVGGDATLSDYCYGSMFKGCESLTTAPSLPATTLTQRCYDNMFFNCTNLTTAPSLPAKNLAAYCYSDMFNGCTSLTKAPALPATTMVDYCYGCMFERCTNLTEAPVLSSENLATGCYDSMFTRCESLATAPALPASTLAECCYGNMFSGCTSLVTPPTLSATNLADGCYAGMFNCCTALTSAPELPATTLVSSCYDSMFYNCTSLKYTTDGNKAGATKIFTCTTENASNEVTGMFGQDISQPKVIVTPENGTTYYWYTE